MEDIYGEYNKQALVSKQLRITSPWWNRSTELNLFIEEYQIYDVTPTAEKPTFKKRFLCSTNYFFFVDEDENDIEKVQVTIKDNWGSICLNKFYNRIDRKNRKFFTNQ